MKARNQTCLKINRLFKQKLKNVPSLYWINTKIKAWQTKEIYQKTVAYYNGRQAVGSCKELLTYRVGESLQRLSHLGRPLNLFYVGTDYLQDSCGILQGLGKFGNLSYFTKKNGEYGQYLPIGEFYFDACEVNSQRLWQLVSELYVNGQAPDILIGQMWAGLLDGNVLSKIRKRFGTIVVNICMDDRHAYLYGWGKKNGGTKGLIPHIDLAATTAPECVEWYLREGCPAIFFPEASDPDIFYPMPDVSKIYDVCFVGSCYGIRKEIVMALRKAGVQVTAYGSGWEKGRIAAEELPKLFAQSKIVLGVGTIGHCRDFYALKMRDLDGPMSGSLYITHNNEDLYKLFDVGKEIVVYNTIDDCIEKVRYFLEHEIERDEIARNGFEKARKKHTWMNRFHYLHQVLVNES
jgi:hypothetical protein